MKLRKLTFILTFVLFAANVIHAEKFDNPKKVKIEKIEKQPKKYGDQESLCIKGTVDSSYSIGSYQLYTVESKKGESITVWGNGKVSPAVGEKVEITGTLQEGFRFGSKTLIVFMEK